METELKEQRDYSDNIKPWQFKKGQSGNPMGRPPGRSLKDRAKAYLAGLSDEEAVEFFEGIDKKVVWEMAEGKAEAKTDITSGGEKLQPVLVKFIDEDNRNTQGV